MYAYLQGRLEEKTLNALIIDVGGVGYEVICGAQTIANAPMRGEPIRVYTHLSVREDAMELLGFLSMEEKNMFLRLTGVSGIGPRTALSILSALPLKDLTLALMTGDVAMLSRAPGIGKKTAQRLALELKDKVSAEDFGALDLAPAPSVQTASGQTAEAMLALETLGYSQQEAARAVSSVMSDLPPDARADDVVRAALRAMMKG